MESLVDRAEPATTFESQVNALVGRIEDEVFALTGTHVFRDGRDGSYTEAGGAIALQLDAALRSAVNDVRNWEWGFGASMLNGDVTPIASEQDAREIHRQSHRLIPVYRRTAAGPWLLSIEPTGAGR